MILETIQTMFRENPLRSFLSLFALVAGSFLLGSAWGIADGLSRLLKQAEGNQGLIITLANGTIAEDGTYTRTLPPQFDQELANLVKSSLSEGGEISPVINTPFNRIMVNNKQYQVRRVLGVDSAFPSIMGLTMMAGTSFSDEAVHKRLPQAIISSEIANSLFGNVQLAIGNTFETVVMGRRQADTNIRGSQTRDINRQQFTIVGVFETPGESWRIRYGSMDMLLPYTAAMPGGRSIPENFFWGTTVLNIKDQSLDSVRHKLNETIQNHYGTVNIAIWQGNPNTPNLDNNTPGQSLKSLVLLVNILGFVLVLVSGVGMYGIMTVEVAGKGRQYGIRRALGASMGNILSLVAVQAAILGFVGSLIGLAGASFSIMPVIQALSPWFEQVGLHHDLLNNLGYNPLPFFFALMAISLSSAVFGLLPAVRIIKTSPVMLLREEIG
jgi:putative ABC transport system permease protein